MAVSYTHLDVYKRQVEEYAKRQLGRAESQEIGAGQQAEVGGAERQFVAQNRPDHCIGRAIEGGEEVGAGARQKESDPEDVGQSRR